MRGTLRTENGEMKKPRKSEVGEIDLEKTDFLENAKFIPGLANDYFSLE